MSAGGTCPRPTFSHLRPSAAHPHGPALPATVDGRHRHAAATGHRRLALDVAFDASLFALLFGRPPRDEDPVPRVARCADCGVWLAEDAP